METSREGPVLASFGRPAIPWLLAALFFAVTTTVSWWKWAVFRYETFDLAFYVQSFWMTLHGSNPAGSLLGVSLLGNHAEPIAYLLLPVFALVPHPMIFVVAQNLAVATMAPAGYGIARRLGLERGPALWLSAALLLAPGIGYAALHEFHPETLAAPLLLLLWRARLDRRLGWWWFWMAALLATKENMSLLMLALCLVQGFVDRREGRSFLLRWYGAPAVLAVAWVLLYGKVITPVLNPGNVDYIALYAHLGASGSDIVLGFFTRPGVVLSALWRSLTHGSLVWGIVLPFAALPFLKPRWFLVAAPLLLQHLLSWRESEWRIYAHYAAPLVPIFWLATVEAIATFRATPRIRERLAVICLLGCVAGQAMLGPATAIGHEMAEAGETWRQSRGAQALLDRIDPKSSVVASSGFLSHLAARPQLYSLHHVLKGLQTLSRTAYTPPAPTDAVLIDYADAKTFDPDAGFYHPRMRTADGRDIASSDVLLYRFMSPVTWRSESIDSITLYRREAPGNSSVGGLDLAIGQNTKLCSIEAERSDSGRVRLRLGWRFSAPRDTIPWLLLIVESGREREPVEVGLCRPDVLEGACEQVIEFTRAPRGDVITGLEAVFLDRPRFLWMKGDRSGAVLNRVRVDLGGLIGSPDRE